MNSSSSQTHPQPTHTSSQSATSSYPFLHNSLVQPIPSDENLMEALFVAGMPRTLVHRLTRSFSRRLDE